MCLLAISNFIKISNKTRSTSSIKRINKSIAKIIKYVALDKVCHWLWARKNNRIFVLSSFLQFFFSFVRLHVTALLRLHHQRHFFKSCQRWQKLYFLFFWKTKFLFLLNKKKKNLVYSKHKKFSWPTRLLKLSSVIWEGKEFISMPHLMYILHIIYANLCNVMVHHTTQAHTCRFLSWLWLEYWNEYTWWKTCGWNKRKKKMKKNR